MPRRLPLTLAVLVLLALALVAVRDGATSSAVADPPPEIEMRQVAGLTLEATEAADATCHTRQRGGGDGVATRTVQVDGAGPVDAKLSAADGDWDLAIFDDTGRTVAAAAGPGATEIASGWAWKAGTLRVQACRRSGEASAAKVNVEHGTIPAALAEKFENQTIKMVSVEVKSRAEKDRLVGLGLDMTEHGGHESLGVVLHGDADEQKLRDAGFSFRVLEDDLVRRGIRERTADAAFARRTARTPIPSGRDEYRMLADYEDEMKKLAGENPSLVRLIRLPEKTWLGREVLGIEIAENVNLNDGRPAFMNMGVHHAREWPSGEHAMEWAYELLNGFKGGNGRATNIVRNSRNIIVPIVNPDGFNASRTAGSVSGADGGRPENVPDTAYIVAGASNGGEYRRKNCRLGDANVGNCGTSAGLAELGTDPNRNYGGLWGGPGAERIQATQTYPGPAPFSEPETRNIKWLVSRNQVMSLITNHTTAGLVLRAPGLRALGDPVDENRGYKALGDAMAMENGYFSQKSFELYDTTGTTEDWSYNATGGYGFTFEIYCGAPNYTTGDCDDPAFHPLFATMVKEWDGTSPQSDHVADPGPNGKFGMQKDYKGGGNREAYYIAAESAINEARHSIIEGDAPAGATLRLTKAFKTETYPQPQEDENAEPKPLLTDDKLDTTYDVPSSGKFRWHINPSTRPIVAKDRGRDARGNPSPKQTFSQKVVPPTTPCTPVLLSVLCNDDQYFTVPTGPGIDNGKVRIRIEWQTQASDYDLKIFRRGASPIAQDPLYSSVQRLTDSEEVVIPDPEGEYMIRVVNTAGAEPWTGTITYEKPDPFRRGITETWTLTCEFGGQVLQTSELFIDRGEVKRPDLGVCDRRVRELQAGPQAQQPSSQAQLPSCTPVRGFSAATARGRSRRVAMNFTRAVPRPVTVDVFQQSVGRRVIGERLVARYTNRSKSFTWTGKANRRGRKVTDGYYFVRYRMDIGGGRVDVRRVTLRRVKGRFSARPSFYRRDTCGILRSYKLTRPVFGGRTNREVSISYRLNQAADVSVVIKRGTRVISRRSNRGRRANVTHRLRLGSERLRRGDYKVTITVRAGGRSETSTLTTRRL